MLYVVIDTSRIKLLVLRKTLLGQFEVDFFEKHHEIQLLKDGKAISVDILASALKEAITHSVVGQEKDVYLVVPQAAFKFLKADVPADIAPPAINAFVLDKARATWGEELVDSYSCYFAKEAAGKTQVSLFAIDRTYGDMFAQACQLVGLKLVGLVPDTMAYFKLFEKTLRTDKHENILYVTLEPRSISSYLFDTSGLKDPARWEHARGEGEDPQEVLKAKVTEYQSQQIKINRIILSGSESEQVRQDTFTKNVGAWTNPLKRIIPNFYDEYVKMLVVPSGKLFPLLSYDTCMGGFLLSQENRDFNLLKKSGASSMASHAGRTRGGGGWKMPFSIKAILLFLLAFGATFGAIYGMSKVNLSNIKVPLLNRSTPTPTPRPPTATPTPTPSYVKEEVKIKVLNGSGARGKASEVKALLNEAGFEEVLTGNADSFDYEQTVIQVKEDMKDVTAAVKEALADAVAKPKVEILDEDETSDVIVIFGTDLK